MKIDYSLKAKCLAYDEETQIIGFYSACHLFKIDSNFGKPLLLDKRQLLTGSPSFKKDLRKFLSLGYKEVPSDHPLIVELRLYEDYFVHWKIHDVDREYLLYLKERYDFFTTEVPDLWEEARKIWHAGLHKRRRLKKTIKAMCKTSKDVTFVTMTFKPSYLDSSIFSARRGAVQRFLNSCDCAFVGNIDFGLLNGREHYHAVVHHRVPKQRLMAYIKRYGTIKCETVNPKDNDALSTYVAKLTNHAIKETTKRSTLMYSRKYKVDLE